MVYYFAYGSNMDASQMNERKAPIKNRFTGILKGYSLVFNKINTKITGAGFANIVKNKKGKVEGIIYEVDEKSLKSLDTFEGGYSRKIIKVTKGKREYNFVVEDKKQLECVVYVANSDRTKEGLVPTIEYLNKLLKGRHFLSKEYFDELFNTRTITSMKNREELIKIIRELGTSNDYRKSILEYVDPDAETSGFLKCVLGSFAEVNKFKPVRIIQNDGIRKRTYFFLNGEEVKEILYQTLTCKTDYNQEYEIELVDYTNYNFDGLH